MSHDICEIYRDICFGNLTIINSQLKLIISIYDKTKQKQTAIFGWLNFFFSQSTTSSKGTKKRKYNDSLITVKYKNYVNIYFLTLVK